MEANRKILPIKTGIEFLSSSHLHIGDERKKNDIQIPKYYESTFQNDYPPLKHNKCMLISVPPPAGILHKDDRIHDQCSITRQQFVIQNTQKDKPIKTSLAKTNFKMDKDDRIDNFHTTHEIYYTPKTKHMSGNTEISSKSMESHIPQGDKDKECWPQSCYSSSYPRKSVEVFRYCKNPNNPVNSLHNVSKTIKGDSRTHGCSDRFDTTSRLMFPSHYYEKKRMVSDNIKYPPTNVPCGEKLPLITTHQVAFDAKPLNRRVYDKEKALTSLRKTTFNIGDERFGCPEATARSDYTIKDSFNKGVDQSIFNSNKPFLAEVQCNLTRSGERISASVNRLDFKAPPAISYLREFIDTSDLHTVSNVSFGKDRLCYETTMERSFPVKHSQNKKVKFSQTNHSSIPIDYYNYLVSNSSYKTDYLPRSDVKKLVPNPAALEDMIKSHIIEPIQDCRQFTTTSSDTYRYKPLPKCSNLTPGRLQKSSLPIGTLSY